jgi:hypothetical protein
VDYIRLIVALVITAVWAAIVIIPVFVEGIDAPVAEVTPVMLLAASYLLGADVVKRLRNGNGKNGGTA